MMVIHNHKMNQLSKLSKYDTYFNKNKSKINNTKTHHKLLTRFQKLKAYKGGVSFLC